MKKKGLLAVILAVLAVGTVSAQFTISGGFALSYMDVKVSGMGGSTTIKGDIGAGGNIYMDYLLPISVPLSLGLEIGIDSSSFTQSGSGISYKDTVLAIPVLLRAAYHFDVHPQLDLYAVAKIGIAFGNWSGDQRNALSNPKVEPDPALGVGVGADLGVAYYFVPRFGLFAEAGFDGYFLQTEIRTSDNYGRSYTAKLEVPFYRFFTIGISTKF